MEGRGEGGRGEKDLDRDFTIKINSKWILDQNVKCKSIYSVQKKAQEKLEVTLDFIKMKSLFFVKDIFKNKPQSRRKCLQNTSENGLAFKIYKDLKLQQ